VPAVRQRETGASATYWRSLRYLEKTFQSSFLRSAGPTQSIVYFRTPSRCDGAQRSYTRCLAMQNLAPAEVKALVEARRGPIAQLRTSNLMMMVL